MEGALGVGEERTRCRSLLELGGEEMLLGKDGARSEDRMESTGFSLTVKRRKTRKKRTTR